MRRLVYLSLALPSLLGLGLSLRADSRPRGTSAAPVPERKEVRRFTGHKSDVYCVAFTPDGQSALSGSFDNTVRRWDVRSGKQTAVYRIQGVVNHIVMRPG